MMNLHYPPLVVTIAEAYGMSWTARVARINAKNTQLPGKEQSRVTARFTSK